MTTKMKKQTTAMLIMLATAAPTMAGDFSFLLNLAGNGRHGGNLALGISTARPQPVVVKRIWVAPVYKTVIERVWIPTTQTAYRDVPVTNIFGRVISYRREAYTIESGYWTEVHKRVLVRPGYWTTTPTGSRLQPAVATVAAHGRTPINTIAANVRRQPAGHRASATCNTPQNNRRSQPTRQPRTLARNR